MKKEIVTFRQPGDYQLNQWIQVKPSSFNGIVNVRRYKVTVEEIPEDHSVIAERIQALWDNCKNHHEWQPLKAAAKEIGYVIKDKNR